MQNARRETNPMYHGEVNHENICGIFQNAADFNVRQLQCDGHVLYTYAIDGLTSGGDISEYVFKPLMENLRGQTIEQLYQKAISCVVVNSVARPCKTLDDVAVMLVNGFCVVLFPRTGAIAFETKTGEKRSLAAPDLEHTAKGPKDAFVETIRSNTSLIRRHLRTPDLRIYETKVGRRSLTNVAVIWIDGLTNPELVERMKKRLDAIDIDGMLSPASVEEYVTGSRMTPFPLLQYTERTDSFCHGLLKGRVGLFADGLPLGYLAPVDVGYLMNSPEDFGRDYISASWVRILRYAALIIGLLLPALYIALTVFHQALLPEILWRMIAVSRKDLPYTSAWEILGLLLAFELLQESGVHLPQSIGQSVSVIGGILIGSAGVEAGVISPMALIVVSVTGVCGFVLPNRDFAAAIRICRFALALLASLCGLVGVILGVILLIFHLCKLKSMDVPYVIIFAPRFLRPRLKKDRKRDAHLHPEDLENQN